MPDANQSQYRSENRAAGLALHDDVPFTGALSLPASGLATKLFAETSDGRGNRLACYRLFAGFRSAGIWTTGGRITMNALFCASTLIGCVSACTVSSYGILSFLEFLD